MTPGKLLQDVVGAQASARPGATAVVDGDRSVTYAELHDRALRLASVLRDRGCDPGDRVALLVPKSIEAIVGMLGSLHAGAIYVPLDPGSPAARLRRIVDSCEPRWVLAAGGAVPKPGSLGDLPLGWLGPEERPEGCAFGTGDLREAPAASPDQRVGPDDPAHILFTSGSTGLPKGVVITHRNVLHFVGWANEYFDVQPGQRNSGHSPLFFDLSSYDVYGTLAAGAELHLVPPSINLLPHKVAAFIRERRLNLWFSVPTVLNQLAKAEVLEPGDLPDLRQVLWCGEVLPLPALRYWMERLPEVRFTNLYGPTEATIASSYYSLKTPPPGPEIPIGRACADEELMVLDGEMQPAPPSEAGDLYIRGPGLSPGYWRDRARTSEVFFGRPRRPHVPHGRPGADRWGRARVLPRPGRLADQEPRLSYRARRDRMGPADDGLLAGVGRGGAGDRRFRGPPDLLRLRPQGGRGGDRGDAARAVHADPLLHDPEPVLADGSIAADRQWQDRSKSPAVAVRTTPR